VRAKLLDRLAEERAAHLQRHHEAHERHGDRGHEAAYPGLSGRTHGHAGQHAAAQPALDASVAAPLRRDAEMREAALRRQARSQDNTGSHAEHGGPSADGGAGGVEGRLRTREEALRVRLKRSRC